MARSPRDPVPAWVDRARYLFASRFVELPLGRMHYVDEGSGEPILFVHGTPTWSYEWRHLIRALSSRWRCVAPDLLVPHGRLGSLFGHESIIRGP